MTNNLTEKITKAEIRQSIIDDLKIELMGPRKEDEFLEERPSVTYIVGVLHPENEESNKKETSSIALEDSDGTGEIPSDLTGNKDIYKSTSNKKVPVEDEDYEEEVEEEDEDKLNGSIKIFQSSIGMNFYIKSGVKELEVACRWGEYRKAKEEVEVINKDGDEELKEKTGYKRTGVEKKINLKIEKNKGKIELEDGVEVEYLKRDLLETGFSLVSVFLVNRKDYKKEEDNSLYQAELEVIGELWSEYKAKKKQNKEDHLFKEKAVYGRGYGCAVSWEGNENTIDSMKTDFMPEQEIPAVKPEIDEIRLSMKEFSNAKSFDELGSIDELIKVYSQWIEELEDKSNLEPNDFKDVKNKCRETLKRLEEGYELLKSDKKAFTSFKYMNKFIFHQYCMKVYSKRRIENPEISFDDIVKKEKGFDWRPFQLAFILINLKGIVDPSSSDREIVDLLWFPTGGGKTEAYLGLLGFTMVYRRLNKSESDPMERDGGVTAILRYTLRLLTTQQRDRLLKMICAAERIRQGVENSFRKKNKVPPLGYERFSVGFWVGGSTTPNQFVKLETLDELNNCKKQILTCPFCGEKLGNNSFEYVDTKNEKALEIKCLNQACHYSKYTIPVYLVDEEIYAKVPTVIMSTVDKFAALPWKEETALLFGKTAGLDKKEHNINIGNKRNPKTKTKEFYPPELIIQDELHLITGPLGTIYGGYEAAIEELCSYENEGKKIKPKYVASTATIVRAKEQIKNLYARKKMLQFPPQGVESGDSFFAKEIPLEEKPFRKYLGISAPGQSMKTTLLRVYAAILQLTEKYNTEELLDVVDPYRTLIGYYNSVRELGGAVTLLKDDIPARMKIVSKRHDILQRKSWLKTEELTSRINSNRIPKILEQLEVKTNNKDCIDVAVATNMIAVGMDVDRLGLMVVTGQPKTTAEYIQATSRIGRQHPGLAICVYNPYRPRDISHYENFKPYHSSLYRYVEGTTATPFSARARDRVFKAAMIALIRLGDEYMSQSVNAGSITLIPSKIKKIRDLLEDRIKVIQPENIKEALNEFDGYIDQWKTEAKINNKLYLHWRDAKAKGYESMMTDYGREKEGVWPTLRSMRDVAQDVDLNYYTGGDEDED